APSLPRHDDLPRLPVHTVGTHLVGACLVSRAARIPGRAHPAGAGRGQAAHLSGTGGVIVVSCSVRSAAITAKPSIVSVNGIVVPRDAIAREVQQHPASTPLAAWKEAARALAIRELLLQEARRVGVSAQALNDEFGRRETEEEASIRALIEQEIAVPEP